MLAPARSKGVDDELVHAEITAYLTACGRQFDLIVSADTLVYFGDLAHLMTGALAAMRPGGLFVFTLEEAVGPDAPEAYRLAPHGPYTHRSEYVERLLGPFGVEVSVER